MKKFVFILVLSLFAFTAFAQSQSKVSIQKENSTTDIVKPEFGLYDDLDDMKRRFNTYASAQKVVQAEKNAPKDDYLWEAPKSANDFAAKKALKPYMLNRPQDYAANPSNNQTINKTEISQSIQSSLNFGKPTKDIDKSWENKLKKD